MKILLDANISWRLKKFLFDSFSTIEHVDEVLNIPARDIEIWDYAKKHAFTILTNDEDFHRLLLLNGFPPKVILLKTGNQRTNETAEILLQKRDQINLFLKDENHGLLIIY